MSSFIFIGDTKVGSSLAANLLEAGFRAAEGIATAETIFVFTPFPDDAEEVFFGTEGVIATAKEGANVVCLSLASPTMANEVFALAQVSNMNYLECILFAADIACEHPFADAGNLTGYVGADMDHFEAAAPMLSAICATLVPCGAVGFGSRIASVAIAQRAASVVGMIEAYAYCSAQGNDAAALKLISSTSALAHADLSTQRLFEAVEARSFTGDYTCATMLSELSCILSDADQIALIIPLCEAAEYLLRLLATIGGQNLNPAALCLLYLDEQTGATYGLDWQRADEMLGPYDDYEDYDGCGYDDYDDGHGHHGHDHGDDAFGHHHGHDFGLN